MSEYVKVYCLACGNQSDSDISQQDAYVWVQEHDREKRRSSPHVGSRFLTIEDGEDYRISPRTVGAHGIAGFNIGDTVTAIENEEAYESQWPRTIIGFEVYGYQGIIASLDDGRAIYLDHAGKVLNASSKRAVTS